MSCETGLLRIKVKYRGTKHEARIRVTNEMCREKESRDEPWKRINTGARNNRSCKVNINAGGNGETLGRKEQRGLLCTASSHPFFEFSAVAESESESLNLSSSIADDGEIIHVYAQCTYSYVVHEDQLRSPREMQALRVAMSYIVLLRAGQENPKESRIDVKVSRL